MFKSTHDNFLRIYNLKHLITYVLQCSPIINEYVNLTFIISLTYLPMKTYTIIDRVKYWYVDIGIRVQSVHAWPVHA